MTEMPSSAGSWKRRHEGNSNNLESLDFMSAYPLLQHEKPGYKEPPT